MLLKRLSKKSVSLTSSRYSIFLARRGRLLNSFAAKKQSPFDRIPFSLAANLLIVSYFLCSSYVISSEEIFHHIADILLKAIKD